jgi:predicted ribosome quality control (RQC) complex YloA/Tae2 family protein
MQLSGLELRYLVNEANSRIGAGYYVSDITGITSSAILLKLHHPVEPDIMLMISTQGLWITSTKFKSIEQNPLIYILSREIERTKIQRIEQTGSERVFTIKFLKHDKVERLLIVEIFGEGNIILCSDDMTIIGILKSIEVRHRVLRVGLKYIFPPKRGEDVFNIKLEDLLSSKNSPQYCELNVARWIGTFTSMPRRFVEEGLRRSNIPPEKAVGLLNNEEVQSIYSKINEVVKEVVTGENHAPAIMVDSNGNPIDAFPIATYDNKKPDLSPVPTFMEAIDQVLGTQILKIAKGQKTLRFEEQLALLEHDLDQQEKAKEEVILKGNLLRNLAKDLMGMNQIEASLTGDNEFDTILTNHNAHIIKEKGKDYLVVAEEFIPATNNLPKLASYLFTRAKELEHGITTIEAASHKIRVRLEDLRNKSTRIENKIQFRKQEAKEWYERYRWCSTSDGFLLVGGKDASSNSAIIRKHMTDSDIVFHAEIHGSPFFLLKNAKDKLDSDVSISQAAQATVSFSRAWKEGLSSADAYWVLPTQVKKGAPTGQFLPKGAFVVEGKRNYVRNVELKLALGIVTHGIDNYSIVCGPQSAVLPKSSVFVTLIPGGLDVVTTAKKIKSELIKVLSASEGSLAAYIKQLSIDELVKVLPTGSFKLLEAKKGDSFPALHKESIS